MSDPIKELAPDLVQAGFDFLGTKYYATSTEALYFYDYFLTLGEEVEYVWKGKKTWMFYMFIFNRYIPMVYLGWMSADISMIYPKCNRTMVLGHVFFVWATFVAQAYLIVRIYALTRFNRAITMFFITISFSQAILGIVFIASSNYIEIAPPDIKLDSYYICWLPLNLPLESAYTSLSVAFDSCAFVVIVVSAFKALPPSRETKFKLTGIFGALIQDATLYYAMIFTSNLTLTMFIFFERTTLKLTPGSGNNLFLPMMVSRLILSLKKAAGPISVEWRGDHFSRVEATDTNGRMEFVRNPSAATGSGVLSTSQV